MMFFFQAHQLEYVGRAEYYQVNENVKSNEGIDLQKLEKQLDEALEKETKESLEEFFFGEPEPEPNAPILFTFDCIRNEEGENQLIIPSHLELKIEDCIYIIREKKPKYPKTYAECCKIVNASIFVSLVYNLTDGEGYSHDVDNLKIYDNIRRLKICRDGYWKIAGEELGLDKPWEPDYTNYNEERYGMYTRANEIILDAYGGGDVNTVLTFPTEEMRDIFYEIFKNLIEQCKELL